MNEENEWYYTQVIELGEKNSLYVLHISAKAHDGNW